MRIKKENNRFSIIREPLMRYFHTGNFPVLMSDFRNVYDKYDKSKLEIIYKSYNLFQSSLSYTTVALLIDSSAISVAVTFPEEEPYYVDSAIALDYINDFYDESKISKPKIEMMDLKYFIATDLFGVNEEEAKNYSGSDLTGSELKELRNYIAKDARFQIDDADTMNYVFEEIFKDIKDKLLAIDNIRLHGLLISIAWSVNESMIEFSMYLVDILYNTYSKNLNNVSEPFRSLLSYSHSDAIACATFVKAYTIYKIMMRVLLNEDV